MFLKNITSNELFWTGEIAGPMRKLTIPFRLTAFRAPTIKFIHHVYEIFMCTGGDMRWKKIVLFRQKLAIFYRLRNTKTNYSLKFLGSQMAYQVIIFTFCIYFTKVVNLLKI